MHPTKRTKRIIMLCISTTALALTIIGMIVLPDTLVVQIGANGQASNMMAKPLGLILPLLLCSVFSVLYYRNDDGEKRNLFCAVVGIICFAFTFLVNL